MIATTLAVVVTLACLAGAVTGNLHEPRHPLLIAAAAAGPIALPCGLVAVLVTTLVGSPTLGAVNAALVAWWRIGVSPRQPLTSGRPEASRDLTILAANLLCYNRKPLAAAEAVAKSGAAVIVTIETAPEMLAALRSTMSGHRLLCTGSGERGELAALWVRSDLDAEATGLCLGESGVLPGAILNVAGRSVTVVGVHLFAPVNPETTTVWQNELATLRTWMIDRERDFVLAGDFNASLNHPGMRELLNAATDAASSLGRPMLRTWPARGFRHGRGRCIPVFGLDHALVGDGIVATALSTVLYPGADHLALQVGLHIEAEQTPQRAKTAEEGTVSGNTEEPDAAH